MKPTGTDTPQGAKTQQPSGFARSSTVVSGRTRTARLETDHKINWVSGGPFFLLHLVPLLAIFTGVTARDLLLCAALYFARMFFITAGYHRYFSHRSYKMARFPQLLMALGGITAAQKGPLWWSGHHRAHHRYADTDLDIHSPRDGFWWSHAGWILSDKFKKADYDSVRDYARFGEIRLVDKLHWVGPWLLGLLCWEIAGWGGVVVGFALSTVLLWHGTFVINSVAHLVGKRRYATADTSRNSFVLAVITNGEGWHNNHHYYPASARQGFRWWELDVSYYALRALCLVGIVKALRVPSALVVQSGLVREGAFDVGMFRSYWERATESVNQSMSAIATASSEIVAGATKAKAHTAEAIDKARTSTTEVLDGHLISTRERLEELVQSARHAADELAKLSKRRQKGVEVAD